MRFLTFHRVALSKIPVIFLFMIFLSAPEYSWANRADSCSVAFRLNMTKMVKEQQFRPDSDYVWLIIDQGIAPMQLVQGPDYTYSCTLFDELDSGVTYHYKFRINDATWETVNRSLTATPGITYINTWWNNESLNYTRFTVNMKYAAAEGLFDPGADSVTLLGTMTDVHGSRAMQRVDTSLVYALALGLDPGDIHQYKFRINADSSGLELQGLPSRMYRVPDTLITVAADFNNYNPSKRAMTFRCNMQYYAKAHHFDPENGFVDVAGNFNGWEANDVLFDQTGDSIYALTTYIDTTWFHSGPLAFKFRISGSWESAELDGKPDRSYAFHDTLQGNPNSYSCYYNDLDPDVPTPPWVYDVAIQGTLIHKQMLSGMYQYENVNGIPEGISVYQWYRCDNAQGLNPVAIDTSWRITYTVDTLDIGKWLIFEITPKAAYGDSAVGAPVKTIAVTPVGGVGIDENDLIMRLFPNPAISYLSIETRKNVERLEILSMTGSVVTVFDHPGSRMVRVPVESLAPGIYFLRVFGTGGGTGVGRFIRQ